MFDVLCSWPFLSWLAIVGFVVLLASRGRMGNERSDLTATAVPIQVSVVAKRVTQTPSEGSQEYKLEFTDPQGATQTIRVSKSFYRQTDTGDTIAVYTHPRSGEYMHESDPFSFAKASTSVMWAIAWILIFVGVVDIIVYLIIDESPWCLVIGQ